MQHFDIIREYNNKIRRFNLIGHKTEFRIRSPPKNVADHSDWIKKGIQQIVHHATNDLDAKDKVGITFCGTNFARGPGWINFQDAENIKWGDVWRMITSVFQSNAEGLDTDKFCLSVTSVRLPTGRGPRRNKYNSFNEECAARKGIVTISNQDSLCLPRALVVGIAYATKDGDYCKVRRDIGKLQTKRTMELLNNSKITIPSDGAGIPELQQFQKYLKDFKITVYKYGTKGRDTIFEGPEATHKINLIYNDNHYNVITSLTAAFCCGYYCEKCHIGYSNKNYHRCGGTCPCCQQEPVCQKEMEISCSECHRQFRGAACHQKHKAHKICDIVKKCLKCLKTYKADREHVCGEIYCNICAKHQPEGHLCFIQPDLRKPNIKNVLYVFYDLETRQEEEIDETGTKLHEPNLCVFQQRCDECLTLDDNVIACKRCGVRKQVLSKMTPVVSFLHHILQIRKTFKKVVVIAHNGQAFDYQFILNYILTKTNLTPELIMRGSKIILMKLENVKFIDSLNYFPMPLSALPKAFDLPPTFKKGYFPHLFNTKANEFYDGPLPDISYYNPNGMKTEERNKFLEWYEEHKADNFNMQRDLIEYCISDVQILTNACLKFNEMMIDTCKVAPFVESCTIASACSLVFRRNFLKPNTIGIIPRGGYRMIDNHSRIALQWLIRESERRNINIRHAGNGKEVKINGVKVDGYCEETKQIFEFQGCLFHGCILCMKHERDSALKSDKHDTLNRRYESTKSKINRLRSLGYEVIEKWECEFRKELNEMSEDERKYLNNHELLQNTPLNPRDAFFGGRTGNTWKSYQCKDGEKIKYVDICSLYPWVCKYGRFPVGHPQLYIGHKECSALNIQELNGLIKCMVLPPKNLYHPVLPAKIQNKLMFVLCRTCAEQLNQGACDHDDSERTLTGTWVSDELVKALELGYKISKFFEIWAYQVDQLTPTNPGIFGSFINTFLKIKQEASGWPSECKTQADRDKYIEDFLNREDIQLEYGLIVKNAGLRCLAKLILNSFWGKYGQRENQPKTSIIRQPSELFGMLVDPEIEINNILPINEEVLLVNWEHKEEAIELIPTVNVAIAAYTTAQARLKLYSYLEKLGENVLYYDTDSVIYVSRNGEWDVPTGSFLGEMTNELEEYGTEAYITKFASTGAKSYSYNVLNPITGETWEKTKVKGFSLNYINSQSINFESMAKMAENDDESISILDSRIRRTEDHRIVTKLETKKYKTTSNKRKFLDDSSSIPYGYCKKLCK